MGVFLKDKKATKSTCYCQIIVGTFFHTDFPNAVRQNRQEMIQLPLDVYRIDMKYIDKKMEIECKKFIAKKKADIRILCPNISFLPVKNHVIMAILIHICSRP